MHNLPRSGPDPLHRPQCGRLRGRLSPARVGCSSLTARRRGVWYSQGFLERFAQFAATATIPRQGGPLADGRAFARYLERRGELTEEGRLEALAVDVRYAA